MVRTTLAVLACAGSLTAAADAQVFFSDIFNPDPSAGSIKRVNANGSGLATVLAAGGGLRGLAVDAAGGKVYWADADNHAIKRANLSGSGVETIVTTNVDFPATVRLDTGAGQLYWGDQSLELIGRSALTGTGGVIITNTPFFHGLAVDAASARLYWTTSLTPSTGDIRRSALDGTGTVTVVSSADPTFKPESVALDTAGGKIYWTDHAVGVVRRANLDGSGLQTLYTDPGFLGSRGIALDLVAHKVYWGQDTDFKGGPFGAIMRMNLDGTGQETFLSGLGFVQDIAIVAGSAPPPCYANCDGSTTPPVLNIHDVLCFIRHFVAGDSYANCDHSTTPPVLRVQDFLCFLHAYAAGCS